MWQDDSLVLRAVLMRVMKECVHQLAFPWEARHLISFTFDGKHVVIILLLLAMMIQSDPCTLQA